jgi:hypothetical protein
MRKYCYLEARFGSMDAVGSAKLGAFISYIVMHSCATEKPSLFICILIFTKSPIAFMQLY